MEIFRGGGVKISRLSGGVDAVRLEYEWEHEFSLPLRYLQSGRRRNSESAELFE